MGGQVTGDFGAFSRLRTGLDRVASRGFRDVMEELAGKAGDLVAEGFATGRAPDGSAWKPTQRGNSPLQGKTGRLARYASDVKPTARGLRVRTSLPYANVHLHGYGAIPARPYLPSEDLSKLPVRWVSAVWTSGDEVLRRWLGGS